MNFRLVIIGLLALAAGALAAISVMPSMFNSDGSRRPITFGKALVGGPFELTDHTGKRVSEQTFKGQLLVVFFGFTHCPDICPAGLQTASAALEKLGAKARDVRVLFITIDPERDTPEQLAQYVSSFHANVVGLTGSAQDIAAAAKAYRVYYRKVRDPKLTEYTMDHTSFIYLMDRDGQFVTHFAHAISPDKLASRLRAAL